MGGLKWGVSAGLVMIAVLSAPVVYAGLEVLPESTHYQGWRVDDDVRIEFAVYDTLGGNEFAATGFDAPSEGRYTYVYQLFNDSESGDFDVEYFQISGIGPGAIDSHEQIGSADDLSGGISSTDAYFDVSLTKGAWEFEDATLIMGKHSVFLVISSDHDWVVGQYTLQRSSDFPVPGGGDDEVPEPMTLVLTGLGGLWLLKGGRGRS